MNTLCVVFASSTAFIMHLPRAKYWKSRYQEERKGKGKKNKDSWSQEILISGRQGRYTQTTEVNTQTPISEEDSTVHPGVLLDSFLFSFIHIQPICKSCWRNLLNLSQLWPFLPLPPLPPWFKPLTSLTRTNVRTSRLVSLPASPPVLIQSFPHGPEIYNSTKANQLMPFPVLASHYCLLHREKNPKSSSRSKELTPSGPGPHLTWFYTICFFITMFQPLRYSCRCFNPPSTLLAPGRPTTHIVGGGSEWSQK